MADLKLRWDKRLRRHVLAVDDTGEPALDEGVVKTAVIAAALSWGRAKSGDVLPGFDGDRKGHWADPYDPRGRKGSRCWLLNGRIVTPRTLADARAYLEEALASVDKVYLKSFVVHVARSGKTGIAARAVCALPDGREETVEFDTITGE